MVDPGRPGYRYAFFGFETDTSMATYLFAVINRAILTETSAFRRANPQLRALRLRRGSTSFQHGMVARVAVRLDTMRDDREAAVHRQRTRRHRADAGQAPRRRGCLPCNECPAGVDGRDWPPPDRLRLSRGLDRR